MKEKLAENDAFVAYLSNPQAEIQDYLFSGLTSDNTQLLQKSDYQELPFFKKTFTDQDGVFNQKAFDNAYKAASDKYFEMADEKAFQNALQWNPGGRFTPEDATIRDVSDFSVNKVKNPRKTSMSLVSFNEEGPQTKTEEELAQMGKIWDSENGVWKEGTAESQGLIDKFFGETLVYAKYTHDGIQENPVTGEYDMHYNGEFMTDEDGNYFTRTLGNEELGNNQVVALSDILTKEESPLNVIDFFDSDGFDKSAWGTTAKLLVTSLPWFIPGVAPYYGALSASLGLLSIMPTFLKAIDSLYTGDEQTAVKSTLREMENWFRKYDSSQSLSRHGKESFFSYESIGNLLGDVFGQIHEQRAAASLAKYIKPIANSPTDLVGDIIEMQKKQNRVGQALSLGYMSLVSAANVYDDAKRGGYGDRVAGAAALASAGALFGIMNFNTTARGVGTWFLDKTTGYSEDVSMKPFLKIFRNSYDEMAQAVRGKFSPEKVNGAFGNLWMKTKGALFKTFVEQGGGLWQRAMVEGVEEVSEEVVQDTVKGIVDFLSWAGYTSKGSFGGFSNVFSKEGAARYMQTLLGGALGGAVFEFQQNHYMPWVMRTFKDPNYKSDLEKRAEKDIFDIIINGQGEYFEKAAQSYKRILNDRRRNIGYINEKGEFQSLMAEGENSEAEALTNDIIRQYKYMEAFVKGITGIDDFSKLNVFQQDAIKSWLEPQKQQILDYNKEAFKRDIDNAWNDYTAWKAKEFDKAEGKETHDTAKSSELKKKFEASAEKVKNLFSGINTARRLQEIQVYMDPNVRELALLPFEAWYKYAYKDMAVSFDDLPEGDGTESPDALTQKAIKAKYDAYCKLHTEGLGSAESAVDVVPQLVDISLELNRTLSEGLNKWIGAKAEEKAVWAQTLDDYSLDEIIENYIEDNFDEKSFKEKIGDTVTDEQKDALTKAAKNSLHDVLRASLRSGRIVDLAKALPQAFTLNDRLKIDLFSNVESALNLDGFSEPSRKIIKQMINTAAVFSGLTSFNKESIREIINSVNESFGDPDNIYARRIHELESGTDETTDGAIATEGITSSIKLNEDLLDMDALQKARYDHLKDISRKDLYISPELAKIIRNQLAVDLFLKLKENNLLVADDSTAFNAISDFVSEFDYDYDEGTLVRIDPFENKKSLLASLPFLDDSIVDRIKLITLLANPDNTVAKFINNATPLFESLEFISDENPLTTALKSVYFKFRGSNEGDTIFEKIMEMQNRATSSDFTADTLFFSEEERAGIIDALKTLRVINAVLGQMYVGEENPELLVHPKGLNQIQRDYLNAYHDGKGADDFVVLNHDDYQTASKYVDELTYKLVTLAQLDSELNKTKSAYYNTIRTNHNDNFAQLYQSPILTAIDFESRKINLLEGWEYDKNLTVEENNRKAEVAIHKNLQALSRTVDLTDAASTSGFLQKLFECIKNIKGVTFLEGSKTWDESFIIAKDGHVEQINGITLFQYLSRLWCLQPKTSFEYLSQFCAANEQFSPRIDQEEALLNIIFALKNPVASNAMLNIIHGYLQSDKDYPNKLLLNNVLFLVGSGGSGKTLLIRLLNSHPEFKNAILFSAKNASNVESVKDEFPDSGNLDTIFTNFDKLDDVWKSVESEIIEEMRADTTTSEITKEIKIDDVHIGTVVCKPNDGHAYISEYTFTADHSFLELSPKVDASKIIALAVVDECTQLNPLQQFLLSKWAEENKKIILELGDPIQPGYTGLTTTENVRTPVDLGSYRGFIVGNLEGMWRAENSAIQDLITQLYQIYTHDKGARKAIFSFSEDVVYREEYIKALQEAVQVLQPVYTDVNKNSKYRVLGYQIVNKSDELKPTIDKINAIPDVSKVVIVPDNTSDDSIAKLKETYKGWEVINESAAQGQQYDYVLVHGFTEETKGIISRSKDLFMLLSRAKRAGLISFDNNPGFEPLGIKTSTKSSSIREFVDNTRDASARERVDEIDNFAKLLEEVTRGPIKIEDDSTATTEDDVASDGSDTTSSKEGTESEKKNWKVFGDDAIIKQMEQWYIRLGLTTDVATLGAELTKMTSLNYQLEHIIKNSLTKYDDLAAFAAMLLSDSELTKSFRVGGKITNVQAFLDKFIAFRNSLSLRLQTDPNAEIFIEYFDGDLTDASETPHEKFNNTSSKAPAWRIGIVLENKNRKGAKDPKEYFITLGSFSVDKTSSFFDTLLSSYPKTLSGARKTWKFKFKEDVDCSETNQKFLAQFSPGDKIKEWLKPSKTPVVYGSGVQTKSFWLSPDGVSGQHIKIDELLHSGWEIVTTGKKIQTFSSRDEALAFVNRYNFKQADSKSDFLIKNRKTGKYIENSKWILLQRTGTNERYPVMLNVAGNLTELLTSKTSDDDHGNLRSYVIQQLTKGLYTAAGFKWVTKHKTNPVSGYVSTVFYPVVKDTVKEKATTANSAFEAFIKANGFTDEQKAAITALINWQYHPNVENTEKLSGYKATLVDVFQKLEKEITDTSGDKKSYTLNGFSFSNVDVAEDLSNTVVSQIVEPPKLLLDFQHMKQTYPVASSSDTSKKSEKDTSATKEKGTEKAPESLSKTPDTKETETEKTPESSFEISEEANKFLKECKDFIPTLQYLIKNLGDTSLEDFIIRYANEDLGSIAEQQFIHVLYQYLNLSESSSFNILADSINPEDANLIPDIVSTIDDFLPHDGRTSGTLTNPDGETKTDTENNSCSVLPI